MKRQMEGKYGCANDAMSERVDEAVMKDMRGGTCEYLCLAEEASLSPRELVAPLPLR